MTNKVWIGVLVGFWTFSVPASAEIWHGLYTDATSYAIGDTIKVYGSAPNQEIVIRLVRLDKGWTEVARSDVLEVGPQSSLVGSFLEYPNVSLAGRTSFTLEGWFHPTLLGGDTVVVAGQFGMNEAAAAIIITPDGRLAAYVSDTPQTDPARLALAPLPPNFDTWLDSWRHLALSYDGAQVKLYVDGILAAQRAQTGPVAEVAVPFRLGARSEAPGDLTGVLDGRLDSWALWPTALSAPQIEARRQRGLAETDPAPDPAEVDLYLGFEGPYPSVDDGSSNGHAGVVTNHGHPGVAGVTVEGRAFRLNHDQIVDAGWQVTTELAIPSDVASGMYAIQALLGPDFTPTQGGDEVSVRAIAVRPEATGPRAPIAVVLPTNTWTAYNHWPQTYGPGITPRSRQPGGCEGSTPRLCREGGNNSAYNEMGDGRSLSYFHGWQRPSRQSNPIKPGAARGGYSVRAPNSMYLVQWLDAQGFAYDVYSDDDFDTGLISAANHRVLMPHSHHEYWSDGMLEALTQFLDDGGSVVAPAGNIFTWRVVYGANRVQEVRKFRRAPVLGVADLQSGIDRAYLGSLRSAALCNGGGSYHGGDSHKALGVVIHLTLPCSNKPFCFGQWAALNTNHWLWQGSGLSDDERFGFGRETSNPLQAYAVGHEADTWVEGMPLPGLAEGQQAVILAEGTDFDPTDSSKGGIPDGFPIPDDIPAPPPRTCQNILDLIGSESPEDGRRAVTKAGTILYFPHSGGGQVLVIGASATPWALQSDARLSGLLFRALSCFANDVGCGGIPPVVSYFPQIGDGIASTIRLQTTLFFVNAGEATAATVEFLNSQGPIEMELIGGANGPAPIGPSSTFSIPLGRGAAASFQTKGTGDLVVGYAKVTAGQNVGGTAVFTRSDGGVVVYEAGVPSAKPISEFSVFLDSRGTRDTGLAIVYPPKESGENDAAQVATANVTMRVYSKTLDFLGETTFTLEPGAHRARFIREFFEEENPDLATQLGAMEGVVTVESNQPLAAVTLRQNDDPLLGLPEDVPTLAVFPVIPGRGDEALAAALSGGWDRAIP